ncbi:MAG: cation:proton antiporter, partial [Chitinivibrionales bacterium]|nr:cation:proton antiporter [Chitinivibrionales bacterium]
MNVLTVVWIALPFFLGFALLLAPRLGRAAALLAVTASAAFAAGLFGQADYEPLLLLDSFGVTLLADRLSAWFILTNAAVTGAVVLYCLPDKRSGYFYAMLTLAHGSINSACICSDFISLYVALEVLSVAAFLLITCTRSGRSIWVGLRYLLVSNVAMLFYLIGAVLVYQQGHSFAYAGLTDARPQAAAFIFLGLLVKGGVFVSGLWLPFTHSEAETPISAFLSGVVVKAGILPMLRCSMLSAEFEFIVRACGVGTALMGVSFAAIEKDAKRMLAFHTISQLGFILAAPAVGGFYAFAHGLVKSCLFLGAGQLPNRNFAQLKHTQINSWVWLVLVTGSLSISGFPLLAGFGAKLLSMKHLASWQLIPMNIAATGTAISFAKFIFLPHAGWAPAFKRGFLPAALVL